MTNVHIQPPICTDRALELSWKDSNIRYLDHLGNSDIAQIRDLRREFASRLRESGASDHDVRDFLGHANITTTSRNLASTPVRLEQALANLEASNRRTSVAQTAESDDRVASSQVSSNPYNLLKKRR